MAPLPPPLGYVPGHILRLLGTFIKSTFNKMPTSPSYRLETMKDASRKYRVSGAETLQYQIGKRATITGSSSKHTCNDTIIWFIIPDKVQKSFC